MKKTIEHGFLSMITIITISLAILTVSGFILFVTNVELMLNTWLKDVRIMVYLKSGLPPDRINAMQQQLQSLKGVQQAVFVSNEEALAFLKQDMKRQASILENIKNNPLPDSFEVYLFQVAKNLERFEELALQIEQIPGVSEVEYGQKWLGRIANLFNLFKITTYALGSLFFIAVLFFVSNTIRLVLYARREEIEIMRLVGASDRFIKAPFYLKSLLQGAIGGILGISLLYFMFRLLILNISNELPEVFFQLSFLSLEVLAAILGGSIMVGWLGCYLSLKRFFS